MMDRCLAILATAVVALAQPALVTFSNRDILTSTIAPGAAPLVLTFQADPSGNGGDLFHVLVSHEGVDVSLTLPSGVVVAGTRSEGLPGNPVLAGPLSMRGYHTFFEVPPSTAPGPYRIKATPAGLSARALVFASYTSSSPVHVAIVPGRDTCRVGTPVGLSGMVFDGPSPLLGATAAVRIASRDDASFAPVAVNLAAHAPVDGMYLGAWTPTRPGLYEVAMRVTGVSSSGIRFSRFAAAEIRVLPPLATIETVTDSAIDENGDGIPDRIVVSVGVKADTAGKYQLLLNLRASNEAVLTGRTTVSLETGRSTVNVPFAFQDLGRLGVDGPYDIRDVFLLYLDDPESPASDDRADAGRTGAYPVAELLRAASRPLMLTPAALSFGDVAIGSTRDMPVTLRNNRAYPFSEAVLRLSNPAYSVVSPAPPFYVPAAGQLQIMLRFRPVAAGAHSGELSIAGLSLPVSGIGVTAPPSPPIISLAPANLNFGNVNVGLSQTLALAIGNTGAADLRVTAATVTNPVFSVVSPAAPFTVAPGGQVSMNVRYAPAAAGSHGGSLAISSNDSSRAIASVALSGSGIAVPPPGPQNILIQIDDGTFETTYGVPSGADGFYLNRLTPPSYPATLKSVRIFFRLDGLPESSGITVLSAAHPSGAHEIPALSLRAAPARVNGTDRFNEYEVPPLTIASGDFLVGFSVAGDNEIRPLSLDTGNFQSRSYVSRNGVDFTRVDLSPGVPRGNFAIRAVVEAAPR